MKLLISGSRSITEFDLTQYITDDVDTILTGGADGIDTIAERYADEHGLNKIIITPDYDKYGKAAPLVRNRTLVELCDKVLAVWDGKSSGTKYTVDFAEKSNKSVILIMFK